MYRYVQKELCVESVHKSPNFIDVDNGNTKDARLGWCQGDLCIGNAIHIAGLFSNNESLLKEGINLRDSTKKFHLLTQE